MDPSNIGYGTKTSRLLLAQRASCMGHKTDRCCWHTNGDELRSSQGICGLEMNHALWVGTSDVNGNSGHTAIAFSLMDRLHLCHLIASGQWAIGSRNHYSKLIIHR